MQVSEARIRANQANAQKSTGPRTDRGKMSSRMNAITHGLSGRVDLVAEAHHDEVEARVVAFEADMRPDSPGGVALVRRMATHAVRMEKAVRWEFAEQAKNVRHAADDFDEARHDQADALFEALGQDPRRCLRKLMRMPEGLDLLAEAWGDLRAVLVGDEPAWTAEHFETAAHLLGLKPDHARPTRFGALSRGVWGDFRGLNPEDLARLDADQRQDWCRERLVERIDEEISALEAHRGTINLEAIALDRAEAGDRATFDLSKGGCLARRYEADAERGFFRALKEFRKVEAESAAMAGSAPMPPPSRTPQPAEPMGSFRAEDWPEDAKWDSTPFEARPREIPVAPTPEIQPFAVGKPRKPAG
jgi:hypothetical protein